MATVVLETLLRGAGLEEGSPRQRDLSDISGTWQEDETFDSALADQQRIDEHLWR